MVRAAFFAGLLGVAACSVRAPAPLDILALTRAEGSEGARRVLVARVLADPRDVQARLALAALADELGRPSDAIAQLAEVVALGGPAGVRWRTEDRARLGRLLHARARVRLARGAGSALGDLRQAASLGEAIPDAELASARGAAAFAQLRHADASVRAEGKAALAELSLTTASWLAAKPGAVPEARAAFGRLLWSQGARRAAWDELDAWHAAITAREAEANAAGAGGRLRPGPEPREPASQDAYLRALAWWSPLWLGDVPPPPPGELFGPEACRFPGAACRASAVLHGDVFAAAMLVRAPIDARARTASPEDAVAWLDLGLRAQLQGDASWGATVRARVDIAAVLGDDQLPLVARGLLAQLGGDPPSVRHPSATTTTLVLPALLGAAARALAGGNSAEVRNAALGEQGRALDTLDTIAEPAPEPALPADVDLRAAGVARYVRSRVPDAPPASALVALARAHRRDPQIAEHIARDAVAAAPDAAAASAAIGAAYEALGDPARARTAWQSAVDGSPEPAYLAGLAVAAAKANDPDAALIFGTSAAAASGDPAVTWVAVARALIGSGELQQGLTAARSAIDLAGPDALPAALELATVASGGLGRAEQAADLAAKRARLAPAVPGEPIATDPTDVEGARAELARAPTGSAVARLWVATRWNPRDAEGRVALLHALPAGDPRLRTIQLELVALAGDADPARALTAVQGLP